MALEKIFAQTTSAGFDNTVWTVVLKAGCKDPAAHLAFAEFCSIYWPPVYSFLRRKGHSRDDAKDITQGFFWHLTKEEDHRLGSIDPAFGKFRSWLLKCLNNFVHNEWKKSQALKRGGGQQVIAIPISEEEIGFWEPADNDDPEKVFLRNWAKRLIDVAFEKLKAQCLQDGKSRHFEILAPFLTGESAHGDFEIAAGKLQISEGAARVAATRLRHEIQRLLKAEVGRTVSDPSEINEEIRFLKSILAGY